MCMEPDYTFAFMKGSELNERIPNAEQEQQFPEMKCRLTHFANHNDYFCVLRGEEVLGIASITFHGNHTILNLMETAKEKRHRGVAKALLGALFGYAEAENKILAVDGFLPDGNSYLADELDRQGTQHPGRLVWGGLG